MADAGGDQTVTEGTVLTLDGSASSGIDDNIATYLWEQVDVTGVLAVLSDPTAAKPQFTLSDVGPVGESLTFQLDQGGLQATDTCDVVINGEDLPPVEEPPVVQPPAGDDDDDEHENHDYRDHHDNRRKKNHKEKYSRRHFSRYFRSYDGD